MPLNPLQPERGESQPILEDAGPAAGLRPDTPWCGVANKEQEGLPFGGIISSKGQRK
jgi:hypothetical protein